jgi:hypothetical protein
MDGRKTGAARNRRGTVCVMVLDVQHTGHICMCRQAVHSAPDDGISMNAAEWGRAFV